MKASDIIRDAVTQVAGMRQTAAARPALAQALGAVKRFQARRFAGSYADLLESAQYRGAARFFLDELYSEKDYSQRDAQFTRIAGALERLFPQPVVQTAVALAQLHCLSEELDLALAQSWAEHAALAEVARYLTAWRCVARRAERNRQLETVLHIGHELDRLTRKPGLRMMLRMMRAPARAAGMNALQQFLESGFDTFAAMGGKGDGARSFLATVQSRESTLFDLLFDAETVACETEMTRLLGLAR